MMGGQEEVDDGRALGVCSFTNEIDFFGRLSDLLAKGANAYDPGRVINISSTASFDPHSESVLSKEGNGTWSCESSTCLIPRTRNSC